MSFIRHVGKIGDRKVAIVFREIPNEPHMALVTYTETLNMHVHDPLMAAIESPAGQQSQNLAEILNRSYTKDGKIILHMLHTEGLLKKVQTAQVTVTPNSRTNIRLDELNKILNEMDQGEAAIKRLQELDNSRGIQDPVDVARRIRESKETPAVNKSSDGLLGDSALASNLRQQATRMHAEAQGLLAESQRLMKEAAQMEGLPLETQPTAPVATAKKRGRPAKVKTPA